MGWVQAKLLCDFLKHLYSQLKNASQNCFYTELCLVALGEIERLSLVFLVVDCDSVSRIWRVVNCDSESQVWSREASRNPVLVMVAYASA